MTAGVGLHPADWELAGGIRVRSTGYGQGDLGGDGVAVERRRRAVVDLPWSVLKQVHGARVLLVDRPGAGAGEAADAAVTTTNGAALAVLTADCAPVALASPERILGVVHAGWRGLRAGVVESSVQAMRRLGATRVEAVIGPCIHSCCYEFGTAELDQLESRYGSSVRSTDRDGKPALDLPAGVRTALHNSGVEVTGDADICTACSDSHWSWRRNGTDRRQATVAWRS